MIELYEIQVGVVGWSSPSQFDEEEAKRMLKEAYDNIEQRYSGRKKAAVAGLTDTGVSALAYREAQERGWRTKGYACAKAHDFPCFPVDEKRIIGTEWGDESQLFVLSLDALIRIGGGNQSLREIRMARELGKYVLEYELAKNEIC